MGSRAPARRAARHGPVHPQESHTASDPVSGRARPRFRQGCLRVKLIMNVFRTFVLGGAAAALLAAAALAALESAESAPCTSTVGRLAPPGGQVRQTEVWGDEAQVRMTGD